MIVQNLILHLLRNLCKNYAVHRDQVLNMLPPPATPCHTDRTGLCQQRSDTSYYQDFAKGNVTLGHSQDGTHSTIWSTGNMYLENHPLLLLPLKEDQPKHQVWLLLKEEGDERIYKTRAGLPSNTQAPPCRQDTQHWTAHPPPLAWLQRLANRDEERTGPASINTAKS